MSKLISTLIAVVSASHSTFYFSFFISRLHFFCAASSGKVLIYIIMPVLFMLRETFQYAVLGLSLVCTWLGFIYPVANAFVLMAFGAPFLFMLFAELKR